GLGYFGIKILITNVKQIGVLCIHYLLTHFPMKMALYLSYKEGRYEIDLTSDQNKALDCFIPHCTHQTV
ncbi:MAG TPA: hypothetical protein VGL94_09215, partial [Ktedonobacteraceae bacterium]